MRNVISRGDKRPESIQGTAEAVIWLILMRRREQNGWLERREGRVGMVRREGKVNGKER